MTDARTIVGKVFRGALYFDSATAFMQALVPFEGKRVEVEVREMPMDDCGHGYAKGSLACTECWLESQPKAEASRG